ncbi:unnamed protein product [Ascophyllum nodosum]
MYHRPSYNYMHPLLLCLRSRLPRWPLISAVGRLSSLATADRKDTPLSLVVFHRHGDRSPLKGHTPDEEFNPPESPCGGANPETQKCDGLPRPKEEAVSTAEEFWREKLVSPEDVEHLDKLYPLQVSPEEAVPPDEVSAPFGCLTSLGLRQLQDRGRRLRERYSHCDLSNARLQAFSTNYRRTQLSAQGFLDGLLDGRGGVPVVVMPRSQNFLNRWESRGREMAELMLSVEADSYFRDREETVGGALKRQLHALDPALFPLPPGGKFRWMMAADYFMSARARGLRVAPELDALGTDTIRQLTWRFGRFYGKREMLRMMAGPLLEHVVQCAMTSSSAGVYDSEETRVSPAAGGEAAKVSSVVSSSCHDVTILALLYAMQSDLIDDEDYWPPYGSTIIFAVSETRGQEQGVVDYDAEGNRDRNIVLTITVDDEPLRSRLLDGRDVVPLSVFRASLQEFLR